MTKGVNGHGVTSPFEATLISDFAKTRHWEPAVASSTWTNRTSASFRTSAFSSSVRSSSNEQAQAPEAVGKKK